MAEYPYKYVWGNSPERKKLKGRKCRVIAFQGRNNRIIEFEDGEQHCVSRYALRKAKDGS